MTDPKILSTLNTNTTQTSPSLSQLLSDTLFGYARFGQKLDALFNHLERMT